MMPHGIGDVTSQYEEGSSNEQDPETSRPGFAEKHHGEDDSLDSDSESDMSISAASDNELGIEGSALLFGRTTSAANTVFLGRPEDEEDCRKRRLSVSSQKSSSSSRGKKRAKLTSPSDSSRSHPAMHTTLPIEIWHLILTYCTPRVLGVFLRVNKDFNSWLTTSNSSSDLGLPDSSTKVSSAEEIWRASRHRSLRGAPAPLLGLTELHMWQLAYGRSCEDCGRMDSRSHSQQSRDVWHQGPGEDGVSPIWQFHKRSCGSCLRRATIKEIDLLLSATIPASLKSALPFIFLTSQTHVVPAALLQASQHPQTIQISKYFLKTHVEEIRREFEAVKILGNAAMEEWTKGLDDLGKTRRNDATRWERWQTAAGVLRMQQDDRGNTDTDKKQILQALSTNLVHHSSLQVYQPNQSTQTTVPTSTFRTTQQFASHPVQHLLRPKIEKTKEEVAALRVHRRLEIERRSGLLDPPISPEVLMHMPSFQAAMQLAQPLTDAAWNLLEPRLISQRLEAERREQERVSQLSALQYDVRAAGQAVSEVLSGAVGSNRSETCSSIQGRLADYADDIINNGWACGDRVSFPTCPTFAADVLVYVWNRFYAEAATSRTGREQDQYLLEDPCPTKLILDDMKWIFENKIKPITGVIRNDLFLCNDCEYPGKYYGFESMIQHYAAKHTDTFSHGSMVVYWKSEWPHHTPFKQIPESIYPGSTEANTPRPLLEPPPANVFPNIQQSFYGEQFTGAPYTGYPQAHAHQTPSHFGYLQNPKLLSVLAERYTPTTYFQSSARGQPAVPLTMHFSHGAHDRNHQPYVIPSPAVPQVGGSNGTSPSNGRSTMDFSHDRGHSLAIPQPQPQAEKNTTFNSAAPIPQADTDYKTRLQHVARIARELWTLIVTIQDVPASVKVYTLLHHLVARIRTDNNEDIQFSMFVDGLNNHKGMRPVRNINGLRCKACSLELPGALPIAKRKHMSLPQLVNHFLAVHDEQVYTTGSAANAPDWTMDLVELPELPKLRAIPSIPGMDEQKLKMLGEALPEIFSVPSPLPISAAHQQEHDAEQIDYMPEYESEHAGMAASVDNHDKYYTMDPGNNAFTDTTFMVDDDEYDPHRPGDIDMTAHSRRKVLRQETATEKRADPITYTSPIDATYSEYPKLVPSSSVYGSAAYPISSVPQQGGVHTGYPSSEDGGVYKDLWNNANISRTPGGMTVLAEARDPVSQPDLRRSELRQSATHYEKSNLPVMPSAQHKHNKVTEVLDQIQQRARMDQEAEHLRSQPSDVASEDGDALRTGPRAYEDMRLRRNRSDVQQATSRHPPNGRRDNYFFENGRYQTRQHSANVSKSNGHDGLKKHAQGEAVTLKQVHQTEQREGEGMYARQTVFADREYGDDGVAQEDRAAAGAFFEIGYHDEYPEVGARPRNVASPHSRTYATSIERQYDSREMTPITVNPRYKQNNAIIREHSVRNTPGRYARYENIRAEQESEQKRTNSRSSAHQLLPPRQQSGGQEHTRSPPHIHEFPSPSGRFYDVPSPNQEACHRVYDRGRIRVPQPIYEREAQYEDVYEYVRVKDPSGDYMIKELVGRRRVARPIYYEDEVHYDSQGRQIVYVDDTWYHAYDELRRPAYEEYVQPVYESTGRREEIELRVRQSENVVEAIVGREESHHGTQPELGRPQVQRLRYR